MNRARERNTSQRRKKIDTKKEKKQKGIHLKKGKGRKKIDTKKEKKAKGKHLKEGKGRKKNGTKKEKNEKLRQLHVTKFSHQLAPLALIPNLATGWPNLHFLVTWPPGSNTCITILLRIVLLTSSVSIEFVSSSTRVISVKSAKHLVLTYNRRHIDRTPYTYT